MKTFLGRDLSNESLLNLFFRTKRAFGVRMRGNIYHLFRIFSKGSGSQITFGDHPKFMNSKWIFLDKNVSFGNYARLETYGRPEEIEKSTKPKIIIGQGTSFGDFTHIGAINNITIGKNVLGASKILIIDHDHGKGQNFLKSYTNTPPKDRELISKGPIIIGDNVWIAEGVVILAGSVIGQGCIIAANSVVKGNVPPYTVFFNTQK
jgi:acyl-[acyl carrier protein]--UDP-N-acetylglucosamine O-acyltransferase